MEVYQLIRKGEMHKDFCEDFFLVSDLNEKYSVYGVFDGCSTGVDSHFASSLLAKVVKAELECLITEPVESIRILLEDAVYNTMYTLRNIRNDLMLDTNELLSTLNLMIVDNYDQKAEILVLGDGYVSVNGQPSQIEQDNKPDYLAYYLDGLEDIEDFSDWIDVHGAYFTIDEIKDVSIATDGISSFQKTNLAVNGEIVPAHYLANDGFLMNNKTMLSRKCNILKNKHQLVNQDDVAMIRIINLS